MNVLQRLELSQQEDYIINQQPTRADERALKEYLDHQGRQSKIALLNRNRYLNSKQYQQKASATRLRDEVSDNNEILADKRSESLMISRREGLITFVNNRHIKDF